MWLVAGVVLNVAEDGLEPWLSSALTQQRPIAGTFHGIQRNPASQKSSPADGGTVPCHRGQPDGTVHARQDSSDRVVGIFVQLQNPIAHPTLLLGSGLWRLTSLNLFMMPLCVVHRVRHG